MSRAWISVLAVSTHSEMSLADYRRLFPQEGHLAFTLTLLVEMDLLEVRDAKDGRRWRINVVGAAVRRAYLDAGGPM